MKNISLIHDQTLEIKYICFIARSIQTHKFDNSPYFVTNTLLSGNKLSVFFPNLKYSTKYWNSLSHLKNYSLTEEFPPFAINFVEKCLPLSNINLKNLESNFLKTSDQFVKLLQNLFTDSIIDRISTIQVHFSQYGSPGAFSFSKSSNEYKLIIISRCDFDVSNIFELILKGIISTTQTGFTDIGTSGFSDRSIIYNYLAQNTKLSQYIKFHNYLPPNNKINYQSKLYLDELGFPKQSNFNATNFIPRLTKLEKRLFLCLYQNSNTVTSFDEVANAVWQNQVNEKYSLYALAKLVQSIRQKLIDFGINKSIIHTIRKQGYIYY